MSILRERESHLYRFFWKQIIRLRVSKKAVFFPSKRGILEIEKRVTKPQRLFFFCPLRNHSPEIDKVNNRRLQEIVGVFSREKGQSFTYGFGLPPCLFHHDLFPLRKSWFLSIGIRAWSETRLEVAKHLLYRFSYLRWIVFVFHLLYDMDVLRFKITKD